VEIRGPFDQGGVAHTPSRDRVFVCHPQGTGEETACVRRILSGLARRAYRRSVRDSDLQPLLAFYKAGRLQGTFETGVERALRALLVSPEFLVRIERDPPAVPSGTTYRIGSAELASRLSFFLWSSIPDVRLLDVALRGRLRDPLVL